MQLSLVVDAYYQHNQRQQNPSVRDLLSPFMKERLDPRQCHTANVIGVSKSIDENIVVDTVELGGAQVYKPCPSNVTSWRSSWNEDAVLR